MEQKIIYYSDELNDEFADSHITPRVIDGNYTYVYDTVWKKFTHFFWYRMIATPTAYLYLKLKYHHKIIGRDAVKPYRKKGYFLYGNHTHNMCDPLIPNFISIPDDAYFIVHPDNVSIPVIGKVTPSLGALPLPGDLKAYKNFISAVETRVKQKNVVVIYPEAHIWPYYTKIRPFKSTSFGYPVKLGVPVFAFTNTYQKRGRSKTPKIVTYVDGPFFADESKKPKENIEYLRNCVYNAMVERSKLNEVELVKYIRKESEK